MPVSKPGRFLYFAYGSNMSSIRLKLRVPSAQAICSAYVQGFRLVFDKVSKDGSSKADCESIEDSDAVVYGGLFYVNEDERTILDQAEGAGFGYESVEVEAQTSDGCVRAMTYLATHKDSGYNPYIWYLHHVLVGAREFKLPSDYVARIATIFSISDPDTDRESRERKIYD